MPITVFSVSETVKAYRYFSARDRLGKVVINFENNRARVAAVPAPNQTIFDSQKGYLLVGCLGGLGRRSLSEWIMARGASNFVFLDQVPKPLSLG